MNSKLPTLGLGCMLAGAVWSAAALAAPPDLTGVWVAQPAPGVDSIMRKLPMTTLAKNKMAEATRLIPPQMSAAESPGAYCLGAPMPALMLLSGGNRMEILQRPERITINTELDGQTRRLFLKNKVDVNGEVNSRLGYATADWAGNTLVVKTGALAETLEGDGIFPHGENAKIVERFNLISGAGNKKTLVLEATLTDADYYSKPVKFTQKYVPATNTRMQNYDCRRWDMRLEVLRAEARAKAAAAPAPVAAPVSAPVSAPAAAVK